MNEDSSLLELARQGDINAIETILNQQLEAKNITAKVSFKENCLQVMLVSEQVPDQQFMAVFTYKKIKTLAIESIERLKIHGKQTGEEFPAWSQEFDLLAQIQHKLKNQDSSKASYVIKNTTKNEFTEVIRKLPLIKNKNLSIIAACLLSCPLLFFVIAKTEKHSQIEKSNIGRDTQINREALPIDTSIEISILEELNKLNQYAETSVVNEHEYLARLDEFKNQVAEYVKARNISPKQDRTEFQQFLASAITAHNLAFYIISDCSTPNKEYECSNVISQAESKYDDLNTEKRNFENNDISSWTKALWYHAKQDTDKAQSILNSATSSRALYNSTSISSSTTKKSYPLTECGLLLTSIDNILDTPENNRVLFQQGKYREAANKIQGDLILIENLAKPSSQNTQLFSAWNNLNLYLRVHRSDMHKLAVAQSNREVISQIQINEINRYIKNEDKEIEIMRNYCN